MIKQFKGVVSGLLLGGLAASGQAAVFVVGTWDFNTYDGDVTTGMPFTTDGNGQLNPIGSSFLEFGSGAGSSDSGPDNSALRVMAPEGALAGEQVGASFAISTLGFNNIKIAFDFDHPPASTQPFRFEYSIEGVIWNELATLSPSDNGFWSNNNIVDLSGDIFAGNNFNLYFRVVAELASDVTTTDALLELDRVRVTGTNSAVPEPTATAVGFGLLALVFGRWFSGRQKGLSV